MLRSIKAYEVLRAPNEIQDLGTKQSRIPNNIDI